VARACRRVESRDKSLRWYSGSALAATWLGSGAAWPLHPHPPPEAGPGATQIRDRAPPAQDLFVRDGCIYEATWYSNRVYELWRVYSHVEPDMPGGHRAAKCKFWACGPLNLLLIAARNRPGHARRAGPWQDGWGGGFGGCALAGRAGWWWWCCFFLGGRGEQRSTFGSRGKDRR
jgi:hypothetical protein